MLSPVEYCAPQRQGKSTLMVRDMVKMLPYYRPEDVFANFVIHIPGVNCLENKDLIDAVFQMKLNKDRHKIILFDEVGQELRARESMNKRQTEFVTFAWQMPKRDITMLYCSNPGNSADIILRLASAQTVVTHYRKVQMPHLPDAQRTLDIRKDDYITAGVIFNWDRRGAKFIIRNVAPFAELFDSWEPIQ
jgi:hypothetical protein